MNFVHSSGLTNQGMSMGFHPKLPFWFIGWLVTVYGCVLLSLPFHTFNLPPVFIVYFSSSSVIVYCSTNTLNTWCMCVFFAFLSVLFNEFHFLR